MTADHRANGDRLPDPAARLRLRPRPRRQGPVARLVVLHLYNSEQANTKLEVNASQNDKDFIAAMNWKRGRAVRRAGQGDAVPAQYAHNCMDVRIAHCPDRDEAQRQDADPAECPGLVYFLPTPKSPHGVDVDPTGEFIVAGGKLATVIPVHSFSKMQKAIADKAFDGEIDGHPDAQVRGHDRGRGAEPRPGAAAHRVRRQGLRLHLDVPLVGDREVEPQGLTKSWTGFRSTTPSAT